MQSTTTSTTCWASPMMCVEVIFSGNYEARYSFMTDLVLHVGDQVVVDTARGFSVGRVVGLEGDESKATRWVYCVIDEKAFHEKLEMLEMLR